MNRVHGSADRADIVLAVFLGIVAVLLCIPEAQRAMILEALVRALR